MFSETRALRDTPMDEKGSGKLWAITIGVNGGLALASFGLWARVYLQGRSWQSDFTSFYTGGFLAVKGFSENLYDYGVQAAAQQQILGGRHLVDGLLPFNYPPHVALLLAPFARLSLDRAYLVWSILQFGLVACLCLTLWRHLESEGIEARSRLSAVCAAVALPAMSATLVLGAFSVLMLLCLLNFALALRRDDDCQAGVWVALMTLKPQVVVVPALVLIAARRWKAVAVAAVCGMVILTATALVLGPGTWLGFASAVSRTFSAGPQLGVTPSDMRNFRGLLVTLFGESATDAVNRVSTVAFLLSLIPVLWLWKGPQATGRDFDLRMAATLLLGLFFCLHVNPQDSVILVGPFLFLWHTLRGARRGEGAFRAFAMVCPSLLWVAERVIHWPLASQGPTIVIIVLGVVVASVRGLRLW